MKTYKAFTEDISPTRLAQLKAKGKGPAAAAKMKADGLSAAPHQGAKEKNRRVQQGSVGQNLGGPIKKAKFSPEVARAKSDPLKKVYDAGRPQSRGLIGTREKITPNNKPKPEWDKGMKSSGYPKPPNKSALATRPADKGADIVRSKAGSLAKTPADKGSLVRSKNYKEPRATRPDERKDVGKSQYSPRVQTPGKIEKKEKGYLGKVKDSAGKQFKKNTVDNFSADKVGRGIANAPGNAARNVLKSIGRSAKRSLRNNPTQDSPKGNIEKVQNNNAIG